MNKFLSRFSTALISLSLAVGIGVSLSSEKGIIRAEATDGTITLANGSYSNGTITWSSEHLSIKQEQGSSTSTVNNSYVSAPRWYASHIITFTPLAGFSIDSVNITCTSTGYASALGSSTYDNCGKPSVSGSSVTITPTDGASVFTVTMGAQSRISQIAYSYSLASSDSPVTALSISGSMTKTEYYLGESWDPTGLSVTATYASGSTASIDSSKVTWTYSPERPAFGVTSVTASATYNGQTASSSAQTVNVTNAILYDLSKISDFSSWNSSYSQHTLTEASFNPAVDTAATIDLLIANKQSSDVGSEYPCLGNKTSTEIEAVKFSLTDSSQVIESVNVTFVTRYTKIYPTLILHKGVGIESTALTEISTSGEAGNEQVLSYSGINDSAFTIGYNANQTSSNGAVGIKSIVVALKEASFGVLDHIKVASMPNKTLYGVGEAFDITGLVITAYDGADELTANSKDVTSSATLLVDNGEILSDAYVSNAYSIDVEYTESKKTVHSSFNIVVAKNENYSLLKSEPSDWTGEYLIVTNNSGSLLGLNASLSEIDKTSNYVDLIATDDTITSPSFNSITIEKIDGGYSVKSTYTGKYIGNTISENALSMNDSPILNTISLNTDGTASIVSNTRTLAFNKNSDQQRFRYFLTPSAQQSVYLYRKATLTKDDFAEMFLKQLTCDPTGVNAPDVEEWDILNLYFDDLSESDKLVFKVSQGNTSGTSVEQAIAKYDYILTKYGVSKYVDFMGRVEYGSLTLTNNRIEIANKLDSESTIMCVVILTLLSVSTIGGYLILKKTKEN